MVMWTVVVMMVVVVVVVSDDDRMIGSRRDVAPGRCSRLASEAS